MVQNKHTSCMDCGGEESELGHLKEHNYKELEVLYEQSLILCDFFDVDFGT